MQIKSLIVTPVMPYVIMIFYIPASIRDYYHVDVLHMGEGATDLHVFMKSRLKGTCIIGHQLQCWVKHS